VSWRIGEFVNWRRTGAAPLTSIHIFTNSPTHQFTNSPIVHA